MTTGFIKPANGPIASGGEFGNDRGAGHSPRYHQGADISVPAGTTVLASADGKISYEGMSGGYGNLIVINHDNGDQTKYAHLSKFIAPNNTVVKQGDAIALSGGTPGVLGSGNSSGAHLHTEHLVNGAPVNPALAWGDTSSSPTTANTAGLLDVPIALGKMSVFLSDPKTWIRIGLASIGVVLIVIALVAIVAESDVAKATVEAAKNTVSKVKPLVEAAAVAAV